ncbi:MAG: Mut7-C RNAse domain-containing protein [Actinobacteria bacterium]|nr:Mut7-C RNAse domain-containing protein [Actinomycetota bacterium]
MEFIADIMVGKLARYLRMAGFDVLYYNNAHDDEIIKIAAQQNRVVITRDSLMLRRKVFKNGNLKSVFVKDGMLKNQLRQIKTELGILLKPNLTRCLVCNSPLVKIGKNDVEGKVPPYVYSTHENFMYCHSCGRYYWRGTHYEYMKKFFSGI